MLRTLVALLILANAAYFAWSQGLLREWNLGPTATGEPQRLESQIEPRALRILSADEVRRVEASVAASSARNACLSAGPFDVADASRLETRLRSLLPADAWTLETVLQPARWIVYMGPYTEPGALAKKLTELKALNVKGETPRNSSLQPGLSLGSYDSRDLANVSLQSLQSRGVRSATVVQEQGETSTLTLKVFHVDESQRQEVEELAASVNRGRTLKPC